MGPHLDPGQRLFVAWLVHHLREQLHLVNGYVDALTVGPLTADQRRDAAAIRAVVTRLLAGLDELLAGP